MSGDRPEFIVDSSEGVGAAEMPRYQSHKKVWALKIERVENLPDGTAMIHPEEKRFARFPVDLAYLNKHEPEAGGYYVLYEGGYKSWSPADVFEAGYKLIEGTARVE